MEAFNVMNEVGIDFLIQMSVSDMNYQEIPAVVEFAEKIGAVAFNLYFLVCTGRGQGNTDISNAAYEEALKILYAQQMKYKGRLMINSKCAPQYKRVVYENDPDSVYTRTYSGGCPAATHYSRISPEGNLTPCPFIEESVGSLKTNSFKDLWENAPLMRQLRDRKQLEGKCGTCEFSAMCSGCRARAFAETGNYMAPDTSCDYEPGQHGGKGDHPQDRRHARAGSRISHRVDAGSQAAAGPHSLVRARHGRQRHRTLRPGARHRPDRRRRGEKIPRGDDHQTRRPCSPS